MFAKHLVKSVSKAICASRAINAPALTSNALLNTASFSTSARKSTPLLHSVVVLASGPDDKDIVSVFSSQVAKLNGNIEESRMTNLGGDFAISALLSVPMSIRPEDVSSVLSETFPDFTIATRSTSASSSTNEPAKLLAFDLEGPDQPKLLLALSDIFFKHNVGVKDIVTDTSSAPFLGYNVFALKAILVVPFRTDFSQFEKDLQEYEEKYGMTMAVTDPAQQQQEEDGEEGDDHTTPAQIVSRKH